ncbi:serine/threonine-protein kinase [Actinoplanes sp. NPDC049265]|uniref:serine/threonine-protein kinase n=1 Tax=Actinoplanes sp. NPDC049265 TaxID=3363902 RepID=UPI0037125BF3
MPTLTGAGTDGSAAARNDSGLGTGGPGQPSTVEPGRTIGDRYRLREPLGSGGMSVVWRAEDVLLGREVAVKVMSAGVSADPASLKRLYAEARAAAALRHENVVEVYDYGETEVNGVPVPYVVMELVEGRSLSALLSAGPLPWRLAMLIGAQVAAALAAAHDRGVVHRDVKPANVMVASGGVKLVDFGISAAVGESDTVTEQLFGTPAYLAPERLTNGMVRPATDVYALGLLVYMMLAGRLPWNASTTTQMLIAHRYRDPAALPAVPGLPSEVADLVRRCLAKAPSDRPPAVTAARVLRTAAGLPPLTLLPGLEDGPRPSPADVPTEPATRPSLSRRILAAPTRHRVAAGGVVLVAAFAVGWLCWPAAAQEQPAAVAGPAPVACHVSYAMRVRASGDSTATLTVTNTAPTAISAWTLAFRLPGDQRPAAGDGLTWKQTGDTIRANGPALAPGQAVVTTVHAGRGEAAVMPENFTLNDVTCRSDLSVLGPVTYQTAKTTTSAAKKAQPRKAHTAKKSQPVKKRAKAHAPRRPHFPPPRFPFPPRPHH